MTKLSSRQISTLAQMTIKQAKILRSQGFAREARQLAEYGLALASSRAFFSSPKIVPSVVRR